MNERPTLLAVWHGGLFPSYRKPFWLLQTEHGWDVHLLCASRWKQALPQMTRFERAANEPITLHTHYPWFSFHGALHLQPRFVWLFNRVRPDALFVVEEPFSLMGWLSVYWGQRRVPRAPAVLFSYQDLLKHYPPPFRWMEQFVLKHADRILVSHQAGGQVITAKGYGKPWAVLPTAVNLERFAYCEPRFNQPYFTLGYAGRLTDEKGLDTLLWAMSHLDDNVRLRLAGEGPARHRLEKLAKELGVYERVAFLPPLSHEAMPSFYHDLDALVLPSKTTPHWQEQFGRVLVEAMACGVPVIGSDSGAIPEVIGDAGIVFPENQPGPLADKIHLLQSDAAWRRDLSLRGRVRVEQRFSAERAAKQINQHLREVLSHARGD